MRAIRFLLLAIGLTAVLAPAALGDFRSSAASCSTQVSERPFTRWLDPSSYVLAPGGTLETGASGWTLNGGAAVVSGNESFFVHDSADTHSLALPGGSTAVTQSMCATLLHSDLRFLARNTGNPLSVLKVDVLVQDLFGHVDAVPFAVVVAGSGWAPTLPYPFAVNALAALNRSGTIAIAFRFTAGAGGNWQIDDVYVDPYRDD